MGTSEGRIVTRLSPSTSKTRERESPRISAVSTPIRSSASSVSSQSAPRGIASLSGPPRRLRGASTVGVIALLALPLLLHLGEVDPLQVEAEARGRHGSAEAADQVVVAAAAAEDVAQRGVVDLDDRAGVVAQVAQQAEVELDPIRDAALDQQVVGRLQPLRRALDGGPAELAGLLEHLRPAPQAGQAQQRLAAVGVEALDRVHLHLQPHQVVLAEAVEHPAAGLTLDPELGQQLAVEVGVAEAEHGAVQPDGVERGGEDLEHLGRALRRRRAEQLDSLRA